jgi:hypothetical protein
MSEILTQNNKISRTQHNQSENRVNFIPHNTDQKKPHHQFWRFSSWLSNKKNFGHVNNLKFRVLTSFLMFNKIYLQFCLNSKIASYGPSLSLKSTIVFSSVPQSTIISLSMCYVLQNLSLKSSPWNCCIGNIRYI